MILSHKLLMCTRIVILTSMVLLILLTGFESLPLTQYQTSYLLNADIQRVRSQIIVKSVLTLAYRPVAEHEQAVSDLQVVLPLFIVEENTLSNSRYSNTQLSIQTGRSDFLAMVSAAQNILSEAKSNKPLDETQVEIVLAHNRDYLTAQGGTISVIQGNVQGGQANLFYTEIVFGILLVALLGGLLFGIERTVWKQRCIVVVQTTQEVA